jgi:N-sulfoglucosamine sulfohydrolase
MNRRDFLGASLLASTPAVASRSADGLPASTPVSKRNVVLFVADDHSPDMGCYGNSVIRTPNMDRVAKEGTRFTHAFCTTASCSASRSVILTGLHNHANGQYGHQHHFHKFSSYDNIVSLPLYLNHAGYRTARCGKYHVAPEAVYQFGTAMAGPGRNPVQMADNCRKFIAEKSDKPFFLYFCTDDPHRSGEFAEELPHKPNRFGNQPPGSPGYAGVTESKYDPQEVHVPGYLPETPAARAEIAQYYQSISRIDQGVGRLMQILRESGRLDETLFIYISDHGVAMPNAKTTLYEGGMNSPCLVRNPYVEDRGVVSNAMVSWVDLTPTILDFAGALDPGIGMVKREVLKRIPANRLRSDPQETTVTRPGEFHGRSFLNLVGKESAKGWDTVYASHTFHEIQMYYPMRVVRERRYKLIWNIAHPLPFPFASDLWAAPTWQAQFRQGLDAPYGPRTVRNYIQRPEFELFDIQNDPYERVNLAVDPKQAGLLEELKGKLKAFQKRTADPWIMKWDYE